MEIILFIIVVGCGIMVRYHINGVIHPPVWTPEIPLMKDPPTLLAVDEDTDAEAFEVNQRLERVLGDPESWRAHDLDSNGALDIDALRAKLEADVRNEREGSPQSKTPVEPPATVEDEQAGHW